MFISRIANITDAIAAIQELRAWTDRMTNSLQSMYQTISLRTDEMIMQGTFAQMPTANGKKRFFWATDTKAMYYDDGAWQGPL